MWDSVRRSAAGLVGIAAVLAFGRPAVLGQQPIRTGNPNVYVNPFATSGRFANAAALGQALTAPAAGRLGYSSLAPNAFAPTTGYGTLAASYANPNLGYGSLMNSSNNNNGNGGYGMMGYGMMGYGWGTQWMMNPYQGYLSGAASLTRANAEYQQTIQQAKLVRQESIRSSIQTRRAMIEEAEWEREHMPDPEKIRQKAIEREIDRARHSPPLTDIWSALALNALLRHLVNQQGNLSTQQGQGAKLPDVPLSEETTERINVTVGNSRGNVGLIKSGADLHWPLSLHKEIFKEPREGINTLLQRAYKSAEADTTPNTAVIHDLRANYEKLKNALEANVDQLTPDDYTEASRYLRQIKDTITALKDPNVRNYFNGNFKIKARNVAELVQFMRDKGLMFGSATPGGENAYVALYNALASFDVGMQRYVNTGGDER